MRGMMEESGADNGRNKAKNCLAVTLDTIYKTELIALVNFLATKTVLSIAVAIKLPLDLEQSRNWLQLWTNACRCLNENYRKFQQCLTRCK